MPEEPNDFICVKDQCVFRREDFIYAYKDTECTESATYIILRDLETENKYRELIAYCTVKDVYEAMTNGRPARNETAE